MSDEDLEILDEGIGSHAFAKLSSHSSMFLGTSLILIHRLGFSERLLYKHLLPGILEKASVILLNRPPQMFPSDAVVLFEKEVHLERAKIYHFRQSSWTEKRDLLEEIICPSGWRDAKNPLIFLLDTLQVWDDDLNFAVRRILENAAYFNLSLWIHSPLNLIPDDLLTTIGNVLVLWPSQDEIRQLKAKLPVHEVDLGTESRPTGAFVHLHFSGEWQYQEVGFW